MKLFSLNGRFQYNISVVLVNVFTLFLLYSCAVKKPKYGKEARTESKDSVTATTVKHTFFLVGDAGNADEENAKNTLASLKKRLNKADKNSTLLFLGDNIYPYGMPDVNDKNRKLAEEKMDNQLSLADNFKGKTIVIPGNHDWYNDGVVGLKRQENYVNEKLKQKKSFLPKDGCAIDDISINENLALVIIDSQWYLEDWDNNPTINDNCTIKTREDFFTELEDVLNKNQKKTTVIAIHHPLMSNGTHGGQFSLEKQLFPLESKIPLPVLGSLINLLRKTTGVSPQDIQNKQYTKLIKRIKALIQDKDNVVVVSGHDHNLQYVEMDNVKQIISGAGSKAEASRAINPKDFSFGGNGYSILEVTDKGVANVSFYGMVDKKEKLLFRHQLIADKIEIPKKKYDNSFSKFTRSSVYDSTMTSKSGFHNFLFGKHYREYYSKPVKVRNVNLDTLYGGLKPLKAGGGHQSKSLRLEDKEGRQYVMRALKKSATRFLQSVAFKDQYVEKEFRDTYAEDFLLDFYTSSHPYTPFVVGDLAEAVGVYHSNPKLFYVPKQNALADFNEDFGDELYMIEERPAEGFEKLESFGKPDGIISTDDVLKNLMKDEKYSIDERAYIRARLFDMLIGDWDRHYDQWRWGEYKVDGKVIYRPIPRDRDQAFPKYGGALLSLLMKMPALRHMQSFRGEIRNVKWFNMEAYPLDLRFLKTSDENVWKEEAKHIQSQLSDAEINEAFKNLPKEVQDETIERIKNYLKERKDDLVETATDYYKVLQKTVLVVGTDKKDKFVITRLPNSKTEVKVSRMKKDGEEFQYSRIYDKKETKEIWLYGLDDDDVFEVKGNETGNITLRMLGGLNHDTYRVENGKKVELYDYRSKENTFDLDSRTRKNLHDSYELNQYDYKKPKYNSIAGFPNIGFNPDDGVKVGVSVTYTVNAFKRNPFTQKHNIRANYYFATSGYEVIYKGIFPNIVNNWFVEMDASITSPNFSSNFFGYGNETKNEDDDLGMNFNRVKIQAIKASPSINWKGDFGAYFSAKATFESMEVDRTGDRFITTPGLVNPEVFTTQNFAGAEVRYGYENYDNPSNPTLGMKFYIEGGYRVNLEDSDRQVPHAEMALGFSHKVTKGGKLVVGTLAKTRMLFSNDYEFYQMATIGGDFDLRAFRFQRFSGKQSFFQTSDIRYEMGKLKNSIVPIKYGFLAGFDYGRVWLQDDFSTKWHNSYGGGVWLNGVNVLTAKLSYFHSEDGGRVSFGLGFGF